MRPDPEPMALTSSEIPVMPLVARLRAGPHNGSSHHRTSSNASYPRLGRRALPQDRDSVGPPLLSRGARSGHELVFCAADVPDRLPHTEHKADAILFVHTVATDTPMDALKGLYAVATVAAGWRQGRGFAALRGEPPELVTSRDALAHPDENLAGFGKRQQANGGEYLPWFSRLGTSYTVRVGPHAIEVDEAGELSLDLANVILTADCRG